MSPAGRRPRIIGGTRTWALGAAIAAGLIHALVVAPRYHVGSFDDDAGYIIVAKALASGAGLTTKLSTGAPLVGVIPPGYPVVLAPLAAIWPGGFTSFRVLSLLLFLAIFPLTWAYLGRRAVSEPVRAVVLVFLALSPVLGTYATMVMPEVAFVVVFLALLLALDRWQSQARALTWAGAATVACAAGLLWLKEAGIGLIIGVAAWLVLRHMWHKAVTMAVVPLVLWSPVLIGRASAGVALIGSRYSTDLGGTTGGFVTRATDIVPHALSTYLRSTLAGSIIPTGFSPLPTRGPIATLLEIFRWTAAPLVLVGAATWARRHGDAAVAAVGVYLVETLFYPFTNERRVILALPVIVAWYVLGGARVFSALRTLIAKAAHRPVRMTDAAVPVMALSAALVTLAVQFPRNYLFGLGHSTSSPNASPYMAFLRALGRPTDVVETDYLSATSLFSGHRTANAAFRADCDPRSLADAIGFDRAGYVLTAAFSGPIVDDGCVLDFVAAMPRAIRLYRSSQDRASVFELIGPGTANPDLSDLTSQAQLSASSPQAAAKATPTPTLIPEVPQTGGDSGGQYLSVQPADGMATLTWSWTQRQAIAQISLGQAGTTSGTTTRVTVELRGPDGLWRPVASTAGPVGAQARTRYLLASFGQPIEADAMRVTVAAGPGGGGAEMTVHDIHALGSAATARLPA